MKEYGVIYKIENKINGKCYIGQTINDFNKRYECSGVGIERVYKFHNINRESGYSYNKHLMSSIEKYGFENFDVDDKFDIAYNQDELNYKETYWINYFDSYYNGYNHTPGGDSGGNRKEIICITNSEIYPSSKDVKLKYDISSYDMFRYSYKKLHVTSKEGDKDLLWMKYNEYIDLLKDDNVKYGTFSKLENMADYLLYCNKCNKDGILSEKELLGDVKKDYNSASYSHFKELEDPIINQYNELRNKIIKIYTTSGETEELRKNKNLNISLLDLNNMLKNISKDLLSEMEYLEKIKYKTNIECNNIMTNDIFIYDLDFYNKNSIKYLLNMLHTDSEYEDINIMKLDLINIISKCNFTRIQQDVLNLWCNGNNVTNISNVMKTSKSNVSRHIEGIVKIVMKKLEDEYKDWYYTFKVKGKYKRCNECGKVKLECNFHNKGYKRRTGTCKQCRSKKYKMQQLIK